MHRLNGLSDISPRYTNISIVKFECMHVFDCETSVVVHSPRKAIENKAEVDHKHCWLCVCMAFQCMCLFHAHPRGDRGYY